MSVPDSITVPAAGIMTAANGVRVHTVDCPDNEVVRVSFVFRAGSSCQDMPFQASATANMLSEGTQCYSSLEISSGLDFLGSYFDVSMDRDFVVVTFCCLSKFFDRTMDIAEQVLLAPVFPQEELAVYCAKRKQRIAVERSKVGFRAREYLSRALFGAAHPYGESYPAEEYDRLTPGLLADFYRRFYTAGNAFVVCSGRLPDDVSRRVLDIAERLPGDIGRPPVEFPDPSTTKEFFERQPGALQSAVRVGKLLFTRSHPDFIAMQVAATVLGGYFGSRLVRNLREERGYTYGVFAGMVNLDRAGYMAVGTEVAAEATGDSIEQIYAEIERLRNEPVPVAELDMVRNIMAGEVMRVLDGPFGIADVTIENIQNGMDNSYVNRLLVEVREMTPERVMEVARRYLGRDGFTTVAVGEHLPG